MGMDRLKNFMSLSQAKFAPFTMIGMWKYKKNKSCMGQSLKNHDALIGLLSAC